MQNTIYLFIIAGFLYLSACNQKQTQTGVSLSTETTDSLKIDSLSKLIERNNHKADLYAERSKLYAEQGKITYAIKDLVFANKLDSLNPEYYLILADFYLGMGKSEMVNSVLQKGNNYVPNNKDILYRLGTLYFYIQDYKKAMAYLNEAQDIDNYFAEVYFTKGLIFNELGNNSKAIEAFQFAVEREPEYYDAYIQLGLLFSEKQDSIALDYFNNALRLIPDSYEALYGKAIFYQNQEKPESAQRIYRYMLNNLSRNLPGVHFNLGYIEMLYYGEYTVALNYFDSALLVKPNYFEALNNKAFCYEKLGKISEARNHYKKVLELQPNFELAIKGLNRLDAK